METYNTQLGDVILKEYGRNIQKLVDHIITIDDREKRTRYAFAMIDLMKQISPVPKDYPEYQQKLWDDLYIISDFRLDVDSPYPMPQKELLGKKPKAMEYNTGEVRFKHYGKGVELMIEKAIQLTDAEERDAAIISIGKIMKSFYSTWNKEVVDDIVILDNMRQLSKGKLDMDIQLIKDNGLFDVTAAARAESRNFPSNRIQNTNARNMNNRNQNRNNQNRNNKGGRNNFNQNKNRRKD